MEAERTRLILGEVHSRMGFVVAQQDGAKYRLPDINGINGLDGPGCFDNARGFGGAQCAADGELGVGDFIQGGLLAGTDGFDDIHKRAFWKTTLLASENLPPRFCTGRPGGLHWQTRRALGSLLKEGSGTFVVGGNVFHPPFRGTLRSKEGG